MDKKEYQLGYWDSGYDVVQSLLKQGIKMFGEHYEKNILQDLRASTRQKQFDLAQRVKRLSEELAQAMEDESAASMMVHVIEETLKQKGM